MAKQPARAVEADQHAFGSKQIAGGDAESRSSVGTARSPSLFATVAFSTRRPSMRTLTATASSRKAVPNATISVDRQLIWSQ
jgi:hypothetical protein